MGTADNTPSGYRFDNLLLDVRNRELQRQGRPLALNSKYFDVLHLLVRHSGQLVEKQKIFETIWDGVIVTDAALTQCIKDIRKALGDDAGNPRYIKTVPKHGYVFVGNAVAIDDAASPSLSTAAAAPSRPASIPQTARPYKFLDYYTEQDAGLFFGRETEVEVICSKILAHRCFILHGRSGVGKSSILRAGIAPRLKSHGHHVFVIRSFTDPRLQMLMAVTAETTLASTTAVLTNLADHLRRLPAAEPAAFLFDQFEEFFSLLPQDKKQRFIAGLAELYANESWPVRLVFAIREDLLAEMSRLKSAIPEVFHHEYRLQRLSREQAMRAMIEPARAVGCAFTAQLAERILDDLGDGGGIDPPQLQIVCDHLYDARDESNRMTLASYGRLGAAANILAGYLKRVLLRFNAAEQETAREMLTAMISTDGQRRILKLSELIPRSAFIEDFGHRTESATGNASSARFAAVLDELVAARIVRRRQQDGEAWLELAHDFLIPEVSRWLTTEARDLKRARGVLERAMENHRAHKLLIDAETLNLLLPFGEKLGLSPEEADLLFLSALLRAREIPQWLVLAAPGAVKFLREAGEHESDEVRLCTVNACQALHNPELQEELCRRSLRDGSMAVRKAAGMILADWLGALTQKTLSASTAGKSAGIVRRAVSLALVRDHEKRLAPLSRHYAVVSLLVVLGLLWVRLRRGFPDILRAGFGGTLGGALSGLLGGLALGSSLLVARHATPLASVSMLLVLVSFGIIVGGLGALGVSFGMIAAAHVTYRHSRLWSAVGAAAGGALIGGVANLLGVDTLWALFGQTLTGDITGAFEGAVIGAGTALGAILLEDKNGTKRWRSVFGAGLGAMIAGISLTVIGGNLFSGSLEIVARAFRDSQLRMDALASFFGELHFGRTTQLIMGAIEGGAFGCMMMAGIKLVSRSVGEIV